MVSQHIIGLMSGSSLDGIDVVYCRIQEVDQALSYEILAANCMPLPENWKVKLKSAGDFSAKNFWRTHVEFGKFLGEIVMQFKEENRIADIDFVASHGHTIFHFPEQKFTTQIGEGAALAAACHLPVVCDFRTADIAHGGTGAPIVPIADWYFFRNYQFCLNLGGIANISAKNNEQIIAYDVVPCNQLLDVFSLEKGKVFDNEGWIARSGNTNTELLENLLQNSFHQQSSPKSLDNSFSKQLLPLFQQCSIENKLRTAVEYIAISIACEVQLAAKHLNINLHNSKMLVTGGGAFNKFLVERIAAHTPVEIVVPHATIIKFKEALAMALLGYLRWHHKENVFSSVTGARKNTINGSIFAD